MSRKQIALTAGVAAVASAAVIATTGSAQGPTQTSLHLVAKTAKGVGFGPNHALRPGDSFGFGERVTGDDTGFDRGICTLVTQKPLCTVVFQLSKGTLTVQGIASRPSKTPFAVNGGTGAYDGARGTALLTITNSTTTDLQITLRP